MRGERLEVAVLGPALAALRVDDGVVLIGGELALAAPRRAQHQHRVGRRAAALRPRSRRRASASSAARRVMAQISELTTAATVRGSTSSSTRLRAISGSRAQAAASAAAVPALSISSPSMMAVVARWRSRLRVVTAPTMLAVGIGDAEVAEAQPLDAADGAVEEVVLAARVCSGAFMIALERRREPSLAARRAARSTSRSVTMPVSPEAARTNTLLMPFSISSRTASRTVVSGGAKIGGALITSRTRWR